MTDLGDANATAVEPIAAQVAADVEFRVVVRCAAHAVQLFLAGTPTSATS